MRKNFVYFILIPVVLLLLVVYLFMDRWVEAGLESAGELVVGARVEIEGLHITLLPLGIHWNRTQVANPSDSWKNSFETGAVAFAIDPGQLLRGKYIIETMEVNDLILGTQRKTDGALPGRGPGDSRRSPPGFADLARQALETTIEPTPLFNLDNIRHGFNPDSLLRSLDLQTLHHLDTLKAQATAASQQWKQTLADAESTRARLTDLGSRIRAIDPAGFKSVDRIVAAIGTVENGITTINDVRKTFDTRRAAVTADVQRLAGSVGTVENIVKEDFRRLLAMARLPDLNTAGIARLLVGKEMEQRAVTYLSWADVARSSIRRYTPEPEFEKPARFKGQDIHFPAEHHYPKLWIKKVLVSGGIGNSSSEGFVRASGEVRHISSDQTVTGMPMTIDLEGTEGGGRSFSLTALFDRRKATDLDEYHAKLSRVPLAEFRVGRADFLPTRILNARMNSAVDIAVPGNRFDAQSSIELNDFTLTFEGESRNIVERLLRGVLGGIRGFTVGVRVWNTAGPFDIAFRTNLDDQLASRVKEVMGAEFVKLQNDLRSRLDAVVAGKRKEMEQLFAAKRAELEGRLQAYDTLIRDETAVFEAKKKELTDRLEKENKGKVEGLLKKIIK
jgi:uncharacterized protein (TIGR03545 family)